MKNNKFKKFDAIAIGRLAVAVIEAIKGPDGDDEISNFCLMHRACQDWFEHPDWPRYLKKIKQIEEALEKYW